ncbi:hypothetical protein BUALT_Bualt01G0224100 [Buddleja alternifolia]|uniref:Membrane insertase YidC/Oxa/ALB C-terminal domain-containing protein n=1 Tax=Buddleja alternifolia TaxID=168488 RepID=A0AAV6YJQ0_9LAMI|nr:hypothetical protein BUALT_Bualt01G0224100 [Buddleja alternifolia]
MKGKSGSLPPLPHPLSLLSLWKSGLVSLLLPSPCPSLSKVQSGHQTVKLWKKSTKRMLEFRVLHLSAGSVVYSLSKIFENGSSLELSKIKYNTMSVLSPDDKCADIVFSYSVSIVKWNKALKVQNLTGCVPPESFRDLTRHYNTFWTAEEDIRAIAKESCSEPKYDMLPINASSANFSATCIFCGVHDIRRNIMEKCRHAEKNRRSDLIILLLVIYRKPIPEKIFYGLDDIKEACDIIIVITTVQLTSGERRSLCQVGKGTLSEDGIGLPGGTIKCFASCNSPQKVWKVGETDAGNQGLLTEGFFWIPSLSGPTTIAAQQTGSGTFWPFPFIDGHTPLGWSDTLAYLVFLVLLVISQYISIQIMQLSQSNDPNVKNSQAITKLPPLMIGYFSLSVPCGLSLNWFTNNILSTVQQVWLRKLGRATNSVTQFCDDSIKKEQSKALKSISESPAARNVV